MEVPPPPPGTAIFILSEDRFFAQLLQSWDADYHILYFGCTEEPCLEGLSLEHSITLSHKEVGGVLPIVWTAHSNKRFAVKHIPWGLQAKQLSHILSPTSLTPGWKACAPPDIEGEGHSVLEALAAGQWDTLVCCKSVFSNTGWVKRTLTFQEIGGLYDLSSSIPPLNAKKGEKPPDLHLNPPTKICQHVLLCWGVGKSMLVYKEQEATPNCVQEAGPMYHTLPNWACDKIVESTAIKADNAATQAELWNERIWSQNIHCTKTRKSFGERYEGQCPLDTLRAGFLRVWRKRVLRSFLSYLQKEYGPLWRNIGHSQQDRVVGRDCIGHACHADWWEWTLGSTLFFWRWPKALRGLARDGHPQWVKGPLPCNKKPQRRVRDPVLQVQVGNKLIAARSKGYIIKGHVASLTSYFAVPKGTSDIRMVYDATKSGLNQALWAPTFPLPGAEPLTDMLDANAWMADLDMGEMFLNFPLHQSLQPYCGVDLGPYLSTGGAEDKTMWERWGRCLMGLCSSPYITTKMVLLADEMVTGDRLDVSNPFHWEGVHLNLPGDPHYDPSQPWVAKRRKDGVLAGGMVKYMDDLRPVAQGQSACWHLAHTVGTRYAYLGMQISPRKTRPPSQAPGPWSGVYALAGPEGVGLHCGQEKWDKAKKLLRDIQSELNGSNDQLLFKPLEQKRGFFIHLMRTYPCITPFLKGLHMTLDSWRSGRDEEGWKTDSINIATAKAEQWVDAPSQAPTLVWPVPRLAQDVASLLFMMQADSPPVRYVRSKQVVSVFYGFGDASGTGFGSTITSPSGETIFRHGLWGPDSQDASSNYRELRNLVETLEQGMLSGALKGAELFLFTDNTTAEGAYYKGNTPSRTLFDLILRLRSLDMSGDLRLHMIHVAGTRMIAQGTDGLSRGDYSQGVMGGIPINSFIPLHIDALTQSPTLQAWLASWVGVPHHFLTPLEWYTVGHGIQGGILNESHMWEPHTPNLGTLVWTPPPAAGGHAVDELLTSRHKRPVLTHVFICPRLFTSLWRKKLHKAADLILELPPGYQSCWPAHMHEPLIVGLTLRFISCPPWELRCHSALLAMGREVQRLWVAPGSDVRPLLRQLLQLPGLLEGM